MLQYCLKPSKVNGYIDVEAEFACAGKETELIFPAWRPGRYELGNFAKNVRNFSIESSGKLVEFTKTSKNRWLVKTAGLKSIKVSYRYFSRELNAGSTYVDSQFFYVNPVNILIYPANSEEQPCFVNLPFFKGLTYVGSLLFESGKLQAKSLHELFDSPFLFAKQTFSVKYSVEQTEFEVWFCGEFKVDEKKIVTDFEKFTTVQHKLFGSFPFAKYRFINIILPYPTYHGVEHLSSTVITLGPSTQLMDGLYTELLGISSHELYHTWNVKSIRPTEMVPYDYSKENYTRMGYLTEGVTTYMGDKMLFASGVFDLKQYLKELELQLMKHFHNTGRLNYSIAESSFDTWLDGYVPGAYGRKVSIYTEGCLIAFLIDVFILESTQNEKSLNDVMRYLYENFAQKGKGVTEHDFTEATKKISGKTPPVILNEFIKNKQDYTSYLKYSFNYIGIELVEKKSTFFVEQLGMKIQSNKVLMVMEESTADGVGIEPGDELTSINRIKIDNAEDWLKYFKGEKVELSLLRNGNFRRILIGLKPNKNQFYNYVLQVASKPGKRVEEAIQAWKNK